MKTWFLNLPLSRKQIYVLLTVGLVPMILVSVVAMGIAKGQLSQQSFQQLEAVRKIKGEAVLRYFERVENQVVTLADSPSVISAMDAFTRSFPRVPMAERLDEATV